MNEYTLYEAFDKGHYIHRARLSKVENYVCGNLIPWPPNRLFWEAEYNYVTKLMIVCKWKQKHDLPLTVKKGEAICNDKLVNFFTDEKHKGCICSIV